VGKKEYPLKPEMSGEGNMYPSLKRKKGNQTCREQPENLISWKNDPKRKRKKKKRI